MKLRNGVRAFAALCAVVVAFAALLVSPGSAGAAGPVVSARDLIADAAAHDGAIVTVVGEVIGDIMHRGTITWINVNDGSGTIGVWGASDLFVELTHAGAYSHRGDTVRVTGTFHRAAAAQGGDLAIEAAAVALVASGGPSPRPADPARLRLAVVAAVIACATGGSWLWRWVRLRRAASGTV